jgi:hypothetical protein
VPEPLAVSLPIQLAARLALDSISYSNPLPPWSDSVSVDYEAREDAIRNKINRYLAGERPLPPFEVSIPKKDGEKKIWKIPSVNDQIVIQACTSALAEKAHKVLNYSHAWSYHYNTNPDRLQLTESQVSLWKQFQDETKRRCKSRSECLLQIDLENAFESIDRGKFFDFLEQLAPGHIAVSLLKLMLDSLSGSSTGLPLINDSVFFIGNAYLHKVDQVVSKYTNDFIRFVDDYRIFGNSHDLLEKILEQISQELAPLGFRIKRSKVKLGSTEEYLEAISNGTYATTGTASDGYISAVAFEDVIEPDLLVKLVGRAVEHPDDLLNEGFGRLSLGATRRIRLNHAVSQTKNYPHSPLEDYVGLLSTNDELIGRALDLFESYLRLPDESWRAIWVLNVLEDAYSENVNLVDDVTRKENVMLRKRKDDLLRFASDNSSSEIVRLRTNYSLGRGQEPKLEELHELGYLEGGARYYGTSKHR